jgi:DNA-binding transcriptional MocR family regulator
MTIWMPVLEKRSARPLYQAIADAIEADIQSGRLRSGDRMPTHRDLAYRVGVTVGTVSRAYAEAGKAGWISGEVGRGTFVLNRRAASLPRGSNTAQDVIDLRLNAPIDAVQPSLPEAFRAILAGKDRAALLRYAPTAGTPRDQLVGADILRRHGLNVEPQAVALCAGAQHGVGLALETLTEPGDNILVEALTYPAIRQLAEARGLRVYPIAIGTAGIARAIGKACRTVRPKALYLNPTLHNPTGRTLSAECRRALVAAARHHGLMVIEDDVHRLLASDAPPPIARLMPEQTVYVASLSKCFAPGLRLGYLAAPPALYERIADAVWRSLWSISPIVTALTAHWVATGEFDRVVVAKRREAAARQLLARKLFGHSGPGSSAYHYWLELPACWSAEAFALAAQTAAVLVTPSTAFHLGSGAPPRAVRLSLSAPSDRAMLKSGLERLRHLIERPNPTIADRSL